MELSSSNIKKILIFSEMKLCTFWPQSSKFFPKKSLALKKILIFSQKKAVLIFPEMEPCTFQSKLEK